MTHLRNFASTIANNVNAQGGGIFTRTFGAGTTATTRLRNTIFANNSLSSLATDTLSGGVSDDIHQLGCLAQRGVTRRFCEPLAITVA